MDKIRLMEKYEDFSNALERLSEVLERDENDSIVVDACIQRFEFTYELSWKLLKAFLSYSGISDEINTPRQVFKSAYSFGLLEDGKVWIEMIEDRNLTSHTYDQKIAKMIFEKIKEKYYPAFFKLREKLSEELKYES